MQKLEQHRATAKTIQFVGSDDVSLEFQFRKLYSEKEKVRLFMEKQFYRNYYFKAEDGRRMAEQRLADIEELHAAEVKVCKQQIETLKIDLTAARHELKQQIEQIAIVTFYY